MSPTFLSRLLLALLSVSFLMPAPASAQSKPKPVDPALEQQVLEVLRKNPEVIYQVLKKFGEEQRAEQERLLAQQERQRADLLATKLRELGVDPDRLT